MHDIIIEIREKHVRVFITEEWKWKQLAAIL